MLAWHNIWMASHGREMARELNSVGRAVASGDKTLMALAVVVGVAVLREGAEVALFLYGVAASGESAASVSDRRPRRPSASARWPASPHSGAS